MSTPKYKQYLVDAVAKLDAAMEEIENVSLEYPSMTIKKDEWVYSMSCCVDKFREKLDLFKKDMNKFSDLIPKERKKRSK